MAHGKNSRLWIETTPGGGTKPPTTTPAGYTAVLRAKNLKEALSKDLAESDSFGSSDHTNEAGLKGGTITFDVIYSSAIMSVLLAAYDSDTPFSVINRPEGDVVGTYQSWADYNVTSIDIAEDTNSVITASVSVTRNGSRNYAAIADS